MDLVYWLDFPLMALGLLAMSPVLWDVFSLRRIVCRCTPGRKMKSATSFVFYLGLCTFVAAGVDAGLAEWKQACRPGGYGSNIRQSMPAPDFSLSSLDEERTVRLSDFRGHKPVVLIFGNFY